MSKARDVIADWLHFEASIQNGFENSRGRSINDHADDILSALKEAGISLVEWRPIETLPMEEDVLIAYEAGHIGMGCFDNTMQFPDITHWAPLPAPPKGEVK